MKAVAQQEFTDRQKKNGQLLMNFSRSFHGSIIEPESVRRMVRSIFFHKAYKEYEQWGYPKLRKHKTFLEFFITPSPEGLGQNIDDLKAICSKEPDLIDMIDRDVQASRPHGINRHSTSKIGSTDSVDAVELDTTTVSKGREPESGSLHGGAPKDRECESHFHPSLTPHSHSAQGIIRRLRKDRPDLHEQVIKGKMTPNEAAVNAGFRPRRRSVSMEDPASAARTLLKYADNAYITELVRHLINPGVSD